MITHPYSIHRYTTQLNCPQENNLLFTGGFQTAHWTNFLSRRHKMIASLYSLAERVVKEKLGHFTRTVRWPAQSTGGGGANRRQLLEFDDGFCYPLGSSGPCQPLSLFGFDVFESKVSCVPFTLASWNDIISSQIILKKKYSKYWPLQHQIKR